VVVKLAVDWRAIAAPLAVHVRAGYAFVPSPAPEQRGAQSLFDNDRQVMTAGAGVYLPARWLALRIDVWGQVQALRPRTHRKDPAAFSGSPPFDRMRTRGTILVGGMTLGVDL